MDYDIIKYTMVGIFMLLLCLFVAVNFGLSRDDIVGRVLNKINIERYAARYHEGVLVYHNEQPLTPETPTVELVAFLTARLQIVLRPADFKYLKIEVRQDKTYLHAVMSRQCSVFYGQVSFLIDVIRVKVPSASIIRVTSLGGLLAP